MGGGGRRDRETMKSLVRCQCPSQGHVRSCEEAPPPCRRFVSSPRWFNPSRSTVSFLQMNETAGKSTSLLLQEVAVVDDNLPLAESHQLQITSPRLPFHARLSEKLTPLLRIPLSAGKHLQIQMKRLEV